MLNQDCKNLCLNHKILLSTILALVGVFLLVLSISTGVGIYAKIREAKYLYYPYPGNITVEGTGEIYTKPDLVLTTFSVVTEAKTVSEALKENTEKMNAIIDFAKDQGVEDKDLRTISFNIYPRYESEEVICALSSYYPCPPGKQVLVGYEVYQSLQVKIRNLEKIGVLIEGATQKGANEVSGLQFTVDKQEEFEKQARQEAIAKAKNKAQEMASQMGVRLVRITGFSESGTTPIFYYDKSMAEGVGGGGETPQVATGENKIEVTVTITYEIR